MYKIGEYVDYKRILKKTGHGLVIQICSNGYIIDDIKYGQTNIIDKKNVFKLGSLGKIPKGINQ